MKNQIGCFVILVLSLSILQSCSTTLEGDLILTNISIIDVKTGAIRPSMDVVIKGDSIASIVKHSSHSQYQAREIIDATDKFLIPGLWDMHTHTWWGYKDFFPLLIANGITGIREMFGDLATVKQIRVEIGKGEIIGPKIISSGPIIDGDPPSWSSSDVADTPEKGREFVRKQKAEGADFIKVYFSLKRDVYLAIADECKKQQMVLTGHIPVRASLQDAMEANHASIEHFYGILDYCSDTEGLARIDSARTSRFNYLEYYKRTGFINETYTPQKEPELIALLSGNKAWVCPTITVTKGVMREYEYNYVDERMDYMPDYAISGWHSQKDSVLSELDAKNLNIEIVNYQLMMSLIKPLQESGVRFLAGSDYANAYTYPGFSLHEELQILVDEARLSPLEALQTATLNPAVFLNLEHKYGSVESGKIANLVVLDKNPLDNIHNTTSLNAVILNGRYLEGNKLKANLEQIATHNRLPKIWEVLLATLTHSNIEEAIQQYKELKKTRYKAYNFEEEQLNILGYKLIAENKLNQAIKIFELNITTFPNYANGYDSMGDAYLMANKKDKAIEVWEKAASLGSKATIRKLEDLTRE